MDIHEYQAKEILAKFGVPVPKGAIAYSPEQAAYRAREIGGKLWVVKAQVHTGGRGKAGGVKLCRSEDEVLEAADIFMGANVVDYSGYPDCRPEFISAFEMLANVATKAGVEGARFRIHAPLLNMSKAQIIETGAKLGVDFSLTHSCYDPRPDSLACGQCDSCRIRLEGFRQAGRKDPIPYAVA